MMKNLLNLIMQTVLICVAVVLLVAFFTEAYARLIPPYSMPPGYSLWKNGLDEYGYSDETVWKEWVGSFGKGSVGRHNAMSDAWRMYKRHLPDPKRDQWEKVK